MAASKAAKLAEDLVGRMERYGRRHRDISEKTLAADEKRRKASDAAAAIATTLTGRVARELEKEHRRMERYDRMHRAAAEKTAASAARETELRRRRETAWKDYLFAEGVSDVSRKMREAEAARRERERTTIGHVGGFRDVAGIAGSAATLVASPDPSAASTISGFGSIVGEAGSALAKIHPVAGAVVSAIGATVGAFGNLMKAIDATAARYAEFSPVIAQAEAYSQIRQTLGDLRRAQEIAPAMVKYIQARTDVQQKFEDIKVKLLQKLVPMVAHILDVALPFIEYQGNRLEFLSNLSHLPAILELLSMIANLFKDNDLDEKMLKEWDPTRMIMEGYLQPGQERGPGGGRGIQVPEV